VFEAIDEQPRIVAAAPRPSLHQPTFFAAPGANQNLSAFCVFP
jgi:hypothetical protein